MSYGALRGQGASTRQVVLVLLAFAAVVLVACGAGSKKGGGSSAGAKPDVLFLPKAVNIPYFDAAAKGAKQAAGELNGKFKQVGPSQGTAAAQIPFINNATGQKVQSLAIAGNDPQRGRPGPEAG